ncbi:MAG: hypothetical protein ACT4PX_05275 [Actinomycetota bacterium]
MPGRFRVYRSLVRLYPRDFRMRYGDDLVQHFGDLVSDRGPRAAWCRTGIDLVVTVPRYRLETIMNEATSATASAIGITLLAAGGVMSVLTGVWPGSLLLVAAAVLAAGQRSALARSIRTPDADLRRRRLRTAAILAVIFVISAISYLAAVSDSEVSGTSLVVHNAVGVPAMVGSIVFLLVGLLTPRGST